MKVDVTNMLATWRKEREDLDNKIKVLEGVAGLFTDEIPVQVRKGSLTPGRVIHDAARSVASNGGGGMVSVEAVVDHLKKQGYTNKGYARQWGGLRGRVMTELYRMAKSGRATHVKPGIYKIA